MLKKSIFTIAAALSLLLPFTLSAQTEDPDGKYTGMFVVQKNIDYNYETMSGTLSIESYLKGEITATRKPLDIVLVLDASGSMNDAYPNNYTWVEHTGNSGKNSKLEKWNNGWSMANFGHSQGLLGGEDSFDTETMYYIEFPERTDKTQPVVIDNLYPVRISNERGVLSDDYRAYFIDKNNDTYWLSDDDDRFDYLDDDKIKEGKNNKPSTGLSQTNSCMFCRPLYYMDGTPKIDILKKAVVDFMKMISDDDANLSGVDHKISIVKFASQKYKGGSSSPSLDEENKMANTTVVKGFTPTTGKPEASISDWFPKEYLTQLNNAVNAIVANGATSADYGLTLAQKLINEKGREGSEKVVILFTDGEPNHHSGFVESVANSAIAISKSLKEKGVRVYSIGVFGGRITAKQMVNIDKYMNGVSSNYPKATKYTSLGNGGNMGFYQNATELDLSTVFSDIAEDIKTMSSLDTHTLLKDIATPSFTLPSEVSADSLKIYTASLTSASGTDYQFGDRSSEDIDDFNVSIVTKDDGEQGLEVSGFDYKENWCGPSHSGKKLIVELPFSLKPTKDLMEKYSVSTNADSSGVYSEYGSYLIKKIEGSVPFKSLTIKMKGLHKGESAIIKLVKTPASGSEDIEVNRITLTGTNDNGATVSYTVPFLDPKATYTATQEKWIWAYGKNDTSGTWTYGGSTVSVEQDMTNTGDNFVMEFTNSRATIDKLPKSAENILSL